MYVGMFEQKTVKHQPYKPGGATLKTLKTRSAPSLRDLLQDLDGFDSLVEEAQNAIYVEAAAVEATLRAKLLGRTHAVAAAPIPDQAVGLKQAAEQLHMTRDYLYRHWGKLGGYRDDDGHVKFSSRAIQRHIERKARRT